MKKKLLIGGGVVLGVIAILVILLFTLFAVHSVEIDFRSSFSGVYSEQEIVESGKFSYGSPILFAKKSSYAKNIEKAYPQLQVVNIETVFPNKLVVHVRERVSVFAFVHNEKTYYCDNNLQILQRFDEQRQYTSSAENPILIDGLKLEGGDMEVGQKVPTPNYVDFYETLLSCNRPLSQQKSMIESIEFSSRVDNQTGKSGKMITLHTFAGNDFLIFNTDKYLLLKAQRFLTAYSSLFTSHLGKPVTDAPFAKGSEEDGWQSEHIGENWTEDTLAQAVIVIDNVRYGDTDHPDKLVYANVYAKDEIKHILTQI